MWRQGQNCIHRHHTLECTFVIKSLPPKSISVVQLYFIHLAVISSFCHHAFTITSMCFVESVLPTNFKKPLPFGRLWHALLQHYTCGISTQQIPPAHFRSIPNTYHGIVIWVCYNKFSHSYNISSDRWYLEFSYIIRNIRVIIQIKSPSFMQCHL